MAGLNLVFPSPMQEADDMTMKYPGMKAKKLFDVAMSTFSGERALKMEKNGTH